MVKKEERNFKYASITSRFLANFYDSLIILLFIIICLVCWFLISLFINNDNFNNFLFLFVLLIIFSSQFVYYTIYDSGQKQTFGKREFNIKVVDKQGKDINKLIAFLRVTIFLILSALYLNILSWLMMLISKRKIGLHDWLTGTQVIKLDKEED